MAGDNRIEGCDTTGDHWTASKGDALEPEAVADGVAALLEADRGAALVPSEAARLGAFLFDAAKVDIVGATRRVVEAREKTRVAAAQTALPGMMGKEAVRPWLAALDAYNEATAALASELAKLDAMVGHDMSEATREK